MPEFLNAPDRDRLRQWCKLGRLFDVQRLLEERGDLPPAEDEQVDAALATGDALAGYRDQITVVVENL